MPVWAYNLTTTFATLAAVVLLRKREFVSLKECKLASHETFVLPMKQAHNRTKMAQEDQKTRQFTSQTRL